MIGNKGGNLTKTVSMPLAAGKPAAAVAPGAATLPGAAMAPLNPWMPLAPAPPLVPAGGDYMGFVYPMLMFMGAKKHKIGGMGASPMLAGCVQTCQAQLGCGEMPEG